MHAGLRIHPEYYPRNVTGGNNCQNLGAWGSAPATFRDLTAYKNNMKGALVTMSSYVVFDGFKLADNGGGAFKHGVAGLDHGANVEFTHVIDPRNRIQDNITLDKMPGVRRASLWSRTTQGSKGTAGQWDRPGIISGVFCNSMPPGSSDHSALGAYQDITFINYK